MKKFSNKLLCFVLLILLKSTLVIGDVKLFQQDELLTSNQDGVGLGLQDVGVSRKQDGDTQEYFDMLPGASSQQYSVVYSDPMMVSESKHGHGHKHKSYSKKSGKKSEQGKKGHKKHLSKKGKKSSKKSHEKKGQKKKYHDKKAKKYKHDDHKKKYHGSVKKSKKGKKSFKHAKKGHHKKGHKDKGFKNVYHKEEYKRKKKFFDDHKDEKHHDKKVKGKKSFKGDKGKDYKGKKAKDTRLKSAAEKFHVADAALERQIAKLKEKVLLIKKELGDNPMQQSENRKTLPTKISSKKHRENRLKVTDKVKGNEKRKKISRSKSSRKYLRARYLKEGSRTNSSRKITGKSKQKSKAVVEPAKASHKRNLQNSTVKSVVSKRIVTGKSVFKKNIKSRRRNSSGKFTKTSRKRSGMKSKEKKLDKLRSKRNIEKFKKGRSEPVKPRPLVTRTKAKNQKKLLASSRSSRQRNAKSAKALKDKTRSSSARNKNSITIRSEKYKQHLANAQNKKHQLLLAKKKLRSVHSKERRPKSSKSQNNELKSSHLKKLKITKKSGNVSAILSMVVKSSSKNKKRARSGLRKSKEGKRRHLRKLTAKGEFVCRTRGRSKKCRPMTAAEHRDRIRKHFSLVKQSQLKLKEPKKGCHGNVNSNCKQNNRWGNSKSFTKNTLKNKDFQSKMKVKAGSQRPRKAPRAEQKSKRKNQPISYAAKKTEKISESKSIRRRTRNKGEIDRQNSSTRNRQGRPRSKRNSINEKKYDDKRGKQTKKVKTSQNTSGKKLARRYSSRTKEIKSRSRADIKANKRKAVNTLERADTTSIKYQMHGHRKPKQDKKWRRDMEIASNQVISSYLFNNFNSRNRNIGKEVQRRTRQEERPEEVHAPRPQERPQQEI
ncbi:micronuclear linker histone polyprotein isoform X3 [Hyalella azteca]|uniref:Micronuclear linker histone polyprotein isoform X3 n=1 Tax=Hyalella azteca TaxID=294128 RepID=A0A979FHT4_HYAAZ|nr:micronuclear linker histone polyprotein isoform X3 [Hyalella azteca]